jgi:hypothetical protein
MALLPASWPKVSLMSLSLSMSISSKAYVPRLALAVAVLALPYLVEHAQVVETGQSVGLREVLDALARLGDVGRQRGREVGDQQEGRNLADHLARIAERQHIEPRRRGGQSQRDTTRSRRPAAGSPGARA